MTHYISHTDHALSSDVFKRKKLFRHFIWNELTWTPEAILLNSDIRVLSNLEHGIYSEIQIQEKSTNYCLLILFGFLYRLVVGLLPIKLPFCLTSLNLGYFRAILWHEESQLIIQWVGHQIPMLCQILLVKDEHKMRRREPASLKIGIWSFGDSSCVSHTSSARRRWRLEACLLIYFFFGLGSKTP